MRSWPRSASGIAACLLAGSVLVGCGDFKVTKASVLPRGYVPLPAVGFNHVYGNSPLTSRDALNYERGLFSLQAYWEMEVLTTPARAGFVNVGDKKEAARARQAVRSLHLVMATEVRATITGVLAYGSSAGQEMYSEELLDYFRELGYDKLQSASVLVFFSEADLHSWLTWSSKSGYHFTVFNNDFLGGTITPVAGQQPLPDPVSLLSNGAPAE